MPILEPELLDVMPVGGFPLVIFGPFCRTGGSPKTPRFSLI